MDKGITLKTFQEITQNLIFENSFTVGNIQSVVDSLIKHKTQEFFKVYGIKLSSNVYQKGKYTFINKNYIYNYVLENAPNIKKDSYSNAFILSILEKNKETKDDFVYTAVMSETYDDLYAVEQSTLEIEKLISALNFMHGFENSSISFSATPTRKIDKFQINYCCQYINSSSELFYAGSPIYIDMFDNELKWHEKVWEIISLDKRNDFQDRIVAAIMWTSKAFVDRDESVKRVEIAFAFESLLQNNEEGFIKESVVALLSEQYAFINGKDLNDRKAKEKEFRDFYRERSGIAHGGKTNYKTDSNSYFHMIISTIYNLLTDERFNKCKSNNELRSIIKNLKYR